MQQQQILAELHLLQHSSYHNQSVIQAFMHRLKKDSSLVRIQNPQDHYVVFFLPIHRPTQQVFLGHHKKANVWIPPGGHIEPGEAPRTTVKREAMEELRYELKDNDIRLFDLSITHCTPGSACTIHYDLWYALEMKEPYAFAYEQREFYDAKWMSIADAIRITEDPDRITILQHLATSMV